MRKHRTKVLAGVISATGVLAVWALIHGWGNSGLREFPLHPTHGQSEASVPRTPAAAASAKPAIPSEAPRALEKRVERDKPFVPPAPRAQIPRGQMARETLRARQLDPYIDAPVLAQEEGTRDGTGAFKRNKIVRAEGKYPLILVQQSCAPDPGSGRDICKTDVAMVANQIMAQIRPEATDAQLNALAASKGAKVLKKVSDKLFLLEFEARDLHTLEQIIAAFRLSPIIAFPEPNFVVRN